MRRQSVLWIAMLMMGSGSVFAAAPVSNISTSSSSLEQRLLTLERLIHSRNQVQIKIQQQLNQIQDEVNELRGVTEVHSHKLEQLNERQRELYQELEKRVATARATPKPQSLVANAPVGNYSNNTNENQAYDRAVNLILKDRRYDQAIPEFEQFIKTYPNSSYLPNAYYWLGQLLFNKAKYPEAKSAFIKVVENYKDSPKRSDALLKLAMVAQKTNDKVEATRLFKQVIQEYPDSVSAKLATERLK